MRQDISHMERFRATSGQFATTAADKTQGLFVIPFRKARLFCIVSDGRELAPELQWEHVSIRAMDIDGSRIPLWVEMCFVKDCFFEKTEAVVQYHPAEIDYVNRHPHVLHLWRHKWLVFPQPPKLLV